jgi:uncharacterized DUF497 family protein
VVDAHAIWDLEDDSDGNVQHILQHGLDMDEVEDVLLNRNNEMVLSRSSDNFIVFGYTGTGRYIAVVVELIEDNPRILYPVTAYDVPEPRGR